VPVFQSLPKLLRSEEFILDPIGRHADRLGQSGERLKALLERRGREGRLLVLLDGLDEVPRERREEAEQVLRGLASRWPASPLVVTSRPIGYRRPGADFLELTLLPLDRARRRDFLARWLGRASGTPDETRAASALASLDSPELRELAGNPLYLTLMALLFESGIEPDRNRTRLYDQVFRLLFEGRHHGPQREPLEAQETVRAVLRRLAYDMTMENRDTEPVTALEERLRSRKLDALRAMLERVSDWSRMRRFLDDLAERTGILGPHDGPDADWRFWHRTFREALTAEQLAEDFQRERESLLARLWPTKVQTALPARARKVTTEEDLNRWAEPFALLVGHVDRPDGLVRALVRKNRPLGLRALATAQNLSDQTLAEILAITDQWEQRIVVYRRLLDLVGEPRRALALLDRLRRRTQNGNDLYFLDLAVQEVARRAPEVAREAAEIRAGFFSHIPPPDENLFCWIDTLNGRVPLWREIPAGRFWMGSLEGKGYDNERPRHEVTITAPFRCGVAPVTNAQYAAFDPGHKRRAWAGDPVAGITWFKACSFCRWLAFVFPWARGARLPTEEEWEYACRAGSQSRYWSGDDRRDLAKVGWYEANSGARTHRVGEKPSNPWGLHDVHGNVWEWTLSAATASYGERKARLRLDPAKVEIPDESVGVRRVLRGGSYWDDAVRARAMYRLFRDPWLEDRDQGFRVVLPVVPKLSIVDH
jgi:formylglycine-generating enzyme required for sulfatase activity